MGVKHFGISKGKEGQVKMFMLHVVEYGYYQEPPNTTQVNVIVMSLHFFILIYTIVA